MKDLQEISSSMITKMLKYLDMNYSATTKPLSLGHFS